MSTYETKLAQKLKELKVGDLVETCAMEPGFITEAEYDEAVSSELSVKPREELRAVDSWFAETVLSDVSRDLAKKYDMVFNNYGMNGSTMSNYVTTNNPMVVRYANMVDNNPDIVIIEGGRNDYNKNVPIGENGSTDTKTMKGAARFLITKIQEKYPNALIICLTVHIANLGFAFKHELKE